MNTHSTGSSIREFFESSLIWTDIEEELAIWLDDIHMQMENNSGELSARTLDRLGGNAEALRNVKDIGKALESRRIETSFNLNNYVRKPDEGENDG